VDMQSCRGTVVMSSWQGFDLPADSFTGFLGYDEFSSPLSAVAPAMNGFVQLIREVHEACRDLQAMMPRY
jgi:hypothetical protein